MNTPSTQASGTVPAVVTSDWFGWVDSSVIPHPPKPGKSSYEQVQCLVVYRGEIEICWWNCEHLVWDDDEGDDFRHKASDVSHWAFMPALPNHVIYDSHENLRRP